jgi:glycosyltransferase involved in cell wall biosynthesis
MAEPACLLTVIVPVYNEIATVREVLDEVLALPLDLEVIVIDNVSTDGTRELVAQLAGAPRVLPVLQSLNRGKGSSVRVGLALARGEFVIIQDADLEYEPRQIPTLLAIAQEQGRQAVFGSRLLGRRPLVPWHHALGRDALNWLFRWLYGPRLTDIATCYKLMRTSLAQSLLLEAVGFDLDYELPCRLALAGCEIVESPVTYQPRDAAAGKKLRWTDGVAALGALLRYRWRLPAPETVYEVGGAVMIVDGPFAACHGTVVEVAGRGEVVTVGFELHGREVRVPCRAGNLRPAEEAAPAQ